MAEIVYLETKDPRVKLLGEIYHARFSCKGERVQRSLGTKNFKVAIQLVDDIQNAILLGEDWRKEKKLFDELWPEFIEAKATGKMRGFPKVRERTLKDYIGHGERWYLPFFGSTRVDKIDADMWDRYMVHVKTTGRGGENAVMLNHWKYLSSFFSWALACGHVAKTPDIYNPDSDLEDDETVGKSYTDDEMKRIRDAAEGPVKVWIMMAQYMGMRSTEITALQKDRIDTNSWIIRLKKADTKTATARLIPVHPEVQALIIEQMARHTKSPYLFPNRDDESRPMDRGGFKGQWTNIRTVTGIDGRFHDFRVSYATRVFAIPGLNPVVICASLGMSLKVALKHYIKFDESQLNSISGSFRL